MTRRTAPIRPLARRLRAAPLALLAIGALAGCRSTVSPDLATGERLLGRTWLITGAEVRPLDRIDAGGVSGFVFADTLRGQLAFSVTTLADATPSGAAAPNTGDEQSGTVLNPTPLAGRWVSVNRPVMHRGVEIPAEVNLLTVPAIRDSFDGSRLDLAMPPLSPFAVGEVHLRADRFAFAPGPYVFTFRWTTASGLQTFSATVPVYIDLPSR